MSTSLGLRLISGSINASLEEIDVGMRNTDCPPQSDIVVGPFADINLNPPAVREVQHEEHPTGMQPSDAEPIRSSTLPTVSPSPVPGGDITRISPMSNMIDSICHMDDFLHCSDLFGGIPDQNAFFPPQVLDIDMHLGSEPSHFGPVSENAP